MKIASIADVHIGNHQTFGGAVVRGMNDRCAHVLRALTAAVEIVRTHKCRALVVNGDLFDTAKPNPQMIGAVQQCFGTRSERDFDIVLLVGNHDQTGFEVGDHALVPLQDHAIVVDQTETLRLDDTYDLFVVPFYPGPAKDWLPREVAKYEGAGGAMFVHLGIEDSRTPPYLQGARDSIPAVTLGRLCRPKRLNRVFAGNWHDPGTWSMTDVIVDQCGALVPTGFNNPGPDYGHVVIYDTEQDRRDRIVVPGPRFHKLVHPTLRELHDAVSDTNKYPGDPRYFHVVTDTESLPQVTAVARDPGLTCKVRVEVDAREGRASARSAANAAKSADTLESAVRGFVDAMAVPNTVDRAEVYTRVMGYLQGA